MAPDGVPEADYESDPEELKRSLATRRREASDDEDDAPKDQAEHHHIDSDGQSGVDGEAAEDEDGDSYDEEEEEEEDGDYGDVDDDGVEYTADGNKTSVAGNTKGVEAEDSAIDAVDGDQQKKPKEPFAVPTAGAFYMHDDRFQELDAALNRRTRGGRRLWQSRDERKWGHDKYEEMNPHDRRTSRGRGRGRGQGRGQERGSSRGSNAKALTVNGHQSQFPKTVTRGRGSRRYEAALRNGNQVPSVQNKQSQYVKVSHVESGRAPTETANRDTEAIQTKRNVVASSLNSASPPFYPSGTSSNVAQKNLQAGMGRLHVNESPTSSGKKFGHTKSSSLWVRTAQPSQTTSQSRGAPAPGKVFDQGDKVSSPVQTRGMSKGTDQSCSQLPGGLEPATEAEKWVNKNGSSKNQYLSGEIVPATEAGSLVSKGKGTLQPSGRGSFMYGGAQFMGPGGNMGAGHGSPNFPAFLPVMQFGSQHGGVPTFGMALPGYVQPEHGTGNPEMTWLPILTGPGALGSPYCPPYAAIDGSYESYKPGLPSSAGSSSQENSSNNPNDEVTSMDRPEFTNNGNSQRSNSNQSKQPRRYSEMSFSK